MDPFDLNTLVEYGFPNPDYFNFDERFPDLWQLWRPKLFGWRVWRNHHGNPGGPAAGRCLRSGILRARPGCPDILRP